MKKISQKQAEIYIRSDGAICPFCGDSNIDAGNIEPDAGVMAQEIECLECLEKWSDVYRLVGVYDREAEQTIYTGKEAALNALTKEDWVEIYYALDSKAAGIKNGEYSADKKHARQWSSHLREIMTKIGPDGENMTGGGS